MRRLALALSFIGLVTACGGDDQPDGAGNGASSSTALRYDSLYDLTLLNEVAVDGVVREVVDDAGALLVTLDVQQTLWSQPGMAGPTGTIQFRQESDGGESVAPAVGDETIVFLVRGDDGTWSAPGGARGRFRVDGGVVTPVLAGGVSLPPNTDVAGFVALLAPEPAPSSDSTGYGYGDGYGYGYTGGSY